MSSAPGSPERASGIAARNAPHAARFVKFLAAGAVNAAFGYVVFLILVWLVPLDWLALLLTYMIGLTFNFFVFARFVFAERIGNVPRYVASYAIAFVINFVLYSALYAWLPNPAIVQLICIPPVAIATYLLMLCWGFAVHAADGRGNAPTRD